MTDHKLVSALLGATALGLAFAVPASAQTTEADACDKLMQLIDEAGDTISPTFSDAAEVAEMSDGNACLLYIDRVETAGGIGSQAEAGSATTDQSQQADLKADVQAVSPDEKEDTQAAQPATDQQGSSETTQAGTDQQGSGQSSDTAASSTETGQMTGSDDTAAQAEPEKAETEAAQSEPSQTEQPTEQGAAETSTTDQATTDQATTDQSTTDQTATDQTATGQTATEGATTDQAATEQPATEETATDQAAGASTEQSTDTAAAAEAPAGDEVAVADIIGRDVVTAEGEDIGEIERIVIIGGEPNAIFERGGFLGIGSKDVAIPAAQLSMQGEAIVLTGMSAADFEALPELEADTETAMADEEMVRIGTAE